MPTWTARPGHRGSVTGTWAAVTSVGAAAGLAALTVWVTAPESQRWVWVRAIGVAAGAVALGQAVSLPLRRWRGKKASVASSPSTAAGWMAPAIARFLATPVVALLLAVGTQTPPAAVLLCVAPLYLVSLAAGVVTVVRALWKAGPP